MVKSSKKEEEKLIGKLEIFLTEVGLFVGALVGANVGEPEGLFEGEPEGLFGGAGVIGERLEDLVWL